MHVIANERIDETRTKWTYGILAHLLWITTAGLGFLCLISARNLPLLILHAFSASRWVAPAVDKFIFLVLAILLLVLVIFAEYYYREAVPKNILWKRFFFVTSIELFFLSGSHLIPILIVSKSKIYGGNFLLPGIELVGGIIFFVCSVKKKALT